MPTIDLNCDLGEIPPGIPRNHDDEIMPYLSSCNVACGFHSSSPLLIERTITAALRHGVAIGAHPSYHDRKNFGRVSPPAPPPSLWADLRYQICALHGMVASRGQRLHHVKPHGALYNDLLRDDAMAERFVLLIKRIDPDLRIVSLAHGNVLTFCAKHKIKGIREGFADRRYDARTRLRARSHDDAVLHTTSDILAQVEGFLQQRVQLADGRTENIQIDTICLHSDTPGAVHLSRTIHQYLQDHDVDLRAVE